MKTNLIKRAGLNALGTFVYVSAVGLFMANASRILGERDTTLTPVAVLLLLVFSAALTGSLVFGQPLLWYIDGKKREAVQLLVWTMAWLLALLVLVFAAMIAFR
jgi:hypothetical protein